MLLEKIERAGFDYFWNEANPENGLVKDRAHDFERTPVDYAPCSVAACGYALSCICVGIERGWIERKDGYDRILTTLRFFHKVPQVRGFFYHFLDMKTGLRTWKSELSPIDSALFLAGALHAARFFPGTEVEDLAQDLYNRVDWPWMLNGRRTLAMGWTPEQGFIENHWDHYCEASLMYFMAIGSKTHPIPATAWDEISRPIGRYKGHICIASPPLFTHQYSHTWIDFRDKYDAYADYFENSRQATLANRQFCLDNAPVFKGYGPKSWGLTASEGPGGYVAYGAKPGRALHDGTIAPTAALGSIVFTPRESLDVARELHDHRPELWGQYGFVDSYDDDRDKWFTKEVLAIDQGTIVLMIENFLTGSVWKRFMETPEIVNAMAACGFKNGRKAFDYSNRIYDYFESNIDSRPSVAIPRASGPVLLDGDSMEWSSSAVIHLTPRTNLEIGSIEKPADVDGTFQLAYDDSCLYLFAVVQDDQFVSFRRGENIHLDDGLEIYIDPDNDNLEWGSERDFQIGLTPSGPQGLPQKWSWFQKSDGGDAIRVASKLRTRDYVIEAAIAWDFLHIKPEPGKKFGFTIAVNDRDASNFAKLTWFFHEPGIVLGQAMLK